MIESEEPAMPNGWGLLRKVASQYEDFEAAAEAFLKLADRRDLVLILAWAAQHMHRAEVRNTERSVFGTGSRRRELGEVINSVELRAQLIAQTFGLGDGQLIPWLEATVEQHQARIAFLRLHVAGVQETIRRHEQAIALIEANGVTCLGEIEAAA